MNNLGNGFISSSVGFLILMVGIIYYLIRKDQRKEENEQERRIS